MALRRGRGLPARRGISPPSEGEMPSLLELDRFDEASIRQWNLRAAGLASIYSSLYFDLESSRQRDGQQLLDAIRRSAIQDFAINDWSRIVDYQYSLTPLSTAGSVLGVGGRFNIGGQIAPGTISPFTALYVAEDYDTAFKERFGSDPRSIHGGLSASELALRSPGSFSQVRLRGAARSIV